jgi:MOSC domain-containing protein YiiM
LPVQKGQMKSSESRTLLTAPVGRVAAVCTSGKKGEPKRNVGRAEAVEGLGLRGDAHAARETHRQVSLLSLERIEECREKGFEVNPGDFAENITTEGFDLDTPSVGSRIAVGDDVVLEITQRGKVCHNPCAIYHRLGKCIMPVRGVFARVVSGGTVEVGQNIKLLK